MLENLRRPDRLRTCAVVTILNRLAPSDYDILTNALADPLWSNEALATGLREAGLSISANTLKRHRKSLCSCGRPADA